VELDSVARSVQDAGGVRYLDAAGVADHHDAERVSSDHLEHGLVTWRSEGFGNVHHPSLLAS
jgi:hypothetical protein